MIKLILGLMTFALTVSFAATNPAANCITSVSKLAAPDPISDWRKATTHALSDKSSWPTDVRREKEIQAQLKHQTDEHNGVYGGHANTPPLILVPVTGTVVKYTRPWQEYGNSTAEVSGTSVQDGTLKATILVPVSAHTGLADAKKWSKTDTYDLYIEDAQGKKTYLVKGAKSLDMITLHDLEIPLVDGQKVTLNYDRSGSGGPGGYAGGRVIELTWNKKNLDVTPVKSSTPFWINNGN